MPKPNQKLTPQLSIVLNSFRAVDVEARTAEFVISDASIDRHETILSIEDWVLDNYGANGIVGYQHEVYGSWEGKSDPDQIIGKGTVFIEDNKLIGKVEFEPEDMDNKLANKIFKKVVFGTLKATSVGFLPLEPGEFRDVKVDDGKGNLITKSIFHYGRRDLLEFSIVNIPSNANAIKRAMDKVQELNGLHKTSHELITCGLKGDNLAAFLNAEIDKKVTDDKSRADIIADMADEAGISESTVGQILRGEIVCPPVDRLEGFARALDISASSIISSAESDGCDYERSFEAPFKNEHSCQIKDAKEFEVFAREADSVEIGDKKADGIFGIKSDGSAELCEIRFDMEKFTQEEAKAWCDANGKDLEIGEKEKFIENSLQKAKRKLSLQQKSL